MRDTILVVGPAATGKTKTLNVLRDYVRFEGIPHVFDSLSDAQTIVKNMLLDDEHGGRNHYHAWCPNEPFHDHTNDHPQTPEHMFPFTVSSNVIPDATLTDFFTLLRDLPQTGELRFAEWAGGVNINQPDNLASNADFSYRRISRLLLSNRLPNEGLERILAVIHPTTDDSLRRELNATRGIPTQDEIDHGTASFIVSDTVMKIFGTDDVHEAHQLFQIKGVPTYAQIHNDGTDHFETRIIHKLQPVLERHRILLEGNYFVRKER